jgi:hypothetical protein
MHRRQRRAPDCLTVKQARFHWIVDCLQDLLGASGINGSTLRFISVRTRNACQPPVICSRAERRHFRISKSQLWAGPHRRAGPAHLSQRPGTSHAERCVSLGCGRRCNDRTMCLAVRRVVWLTGVARSCEIRYSANRLSRDEAFLIAANTAKLPSVPRQVLKPSGCRYYPRCLSAFSRKIRSRQE